MPFLPPKCPSCASSSSLDTGSRLELPWEAEGITPLSENLNLLDGMRPEAAEETPSDQPGTASWLLAKSKMSPSIIGHAPSLSKAGEGDLPGSSLASPSLMS